MEEETKNQEETQPEQEENQPEKESKDIAKEKFEEIGKPLEKMTAIELREVAMRIPGITGASAMKKDELLAGIKEAWGIVDEEETVVKKKEVRPGVTVKDLKAKVARFKEEKAAARQANDQRKVEIMRRRINRLKKKTRKAARA